MFAEGGQDLGLPQRVDAELTLQIEVQFQNLRRIPRLGPRHVENEAIDRGDIEWRRSGRRRWLDRRWLDRRWLDGPPHLGRRARAGGRRLGRRHAPGTRARQVAEERVESRIVRHGGAGHRRPQVVAHRPNDVVPYPAAHPELGRHPLSRIQQRQRVSGHARHDRQQSRMPGLDGRTTGPRAAVGVPPPSLTRPVPAKRMDFGERGEPVHTFHSAQRRDVGGNDERLAAG